MKTTSLKSDILIMVLVMPLAFFISTGLLSDTTELSFNYFLTCFVSITFGILLGSGFFSYFLVSIRRMKFSPLFTWLITLAVGILLGFITIEFVEAHVSIFSSIEFVIGFFLAAWTLSLKSPTSSISNSS